MSNSATNSSSADTNLDNGKNSKKPTILKTFTDFDTIKEYAVYLNSVIGWNHLNSEKWILKTEQILRILELETRYPYSDYTEALDNAIDCFVFSNFEVPNESTEVKNSYECIKEFKKLFSSLENAEVGTREVLINDYFYNYWSAEIITNLCETIKCFVIYSFEKEMTGDKPAYDYAVLEYLKSIVLEIVELEK